MEKVVSGGTMVECQECHRFFYGHVNRKYCSECSQEKTRARNRNKKKKQKEDESLRHFVTPPFRAREAKGAGEGNVYISAQERFGISSETGRIYAFVHEAEEYNRLHGTRLSYGQYESLLNCVKEKRKNDKNPSTASGPPPFRQGRQKGKGKGKSK